MFRRRRTARREAGGTGHRTARHSVLGAALVLLAGGCATLGIVELAPNGLPSSEDALRRLLAVHPDAAVKAVQRRGSAAPRDALLRYLYQGAALHYAGEYRKSGALLDHAYAVTEDRFTRSLSRGAASLLTNDRALAYVPSRTERLMVHYYAALGYLLDGDRVGAAVEARRLAALLAVEQGRGADGVRAGTLAFFRYFTGAVFEANGEWNDADVAYRNALALHAADSTADLGDLRTSPPPADSGDVIVLIEEGFVAHKIEHNLVMLLLPEEVQALAGGSASEVIAAAAVVSTRVLFSLAAAPHDGRRHGNTIYVPNPTMGYTAPDSTHSSESDEYLLHVAWPQFVRDSRHTSGASVVLTGGAQVGTLHAADLSAGVMSDFDEQKAMILARAIARGAVKFAATKKAEKKAKDERGETTGEVVGLLTNIAGALTERADTRSWHLMPDRVSAVRLRLPAGTHQVEVRFDDRRVQQLEVEVPGGGYVFESARGWR